MTREYSSTKPGYIQSVNRFCYEVAQLALKDICLPHLDEKEIDYVADLMDDIAFVITEEYNVNVFDFSLDVNTHTKRYVDEILEDNTSPTIFLI